MIQLLQPLEEAGQANQMARHLPQGQVWARKFDTASNLHKLLLGWSVEFYRLNLLLTNTLNNELDVDSTDALISEWEKMVGIPDECFTNTGTLEERRRNAKLKFTDYGGIQNKEDFIGLAAAFGFTALITTAFENGVFPLAFPIRFFASKKEASHTILVDLEEQREVFPLAFPIEFSSGVSGIIECLFLELVPGNVNVLFRYGIT